MTNLVQDIDAWQWPEAGLKLCERYFHFQGKLRHVFEADGFTKAFLKVLSDRWATKFRDLLKASDDSEPLSASSEPLDWFWKELQKELLLVAAISNDHSKVYPECGTIIPSAIAASVASATVNAKAR